MKDDAANSAQLLLSSADRGGVEGSDFRQPKLSHLVADKIRSQIASGRLAHGSHLPLEAELVVLLKVSRTTLREALRILEAESLITLGRGVRAGAKISVPNSLKAAEYTGFLLASKGVTISDVHQARMFSEPSMVRSIAMSVSQEGIEKLRCCIEDMGQAVASHNFGRVIAATNRFHETLATLSGNRTIGLILEILREIGDAFAHSLYREATPSELEADVVHTMATYRKLCNLLERRKAAQAEALWIKHMQEGQEFLTLSGIGRRPITTYSFS